jgi:hypothetical protein
MKRSSKGKRYKKKKRRRILEEGDIETREEM